MALNKAILLDKDGTLIKDVPYNVDPAKVSFVPGAFRALKGAQQAGFKLVLVTNQSGLAKKYFSRQQLDQLLQYVDRQLLARGIRLDAAYFCPHAPAEQGGFACECRKPLPGLIVQAQRELSIEPSQSFMVGDILNDVEAGHRAGCRSVLINAQNETEWQLSTYRTPDYIAPTFSDAINWIIKQDSDIGTVISREKGSEYDHAY